MGKSETLKQLERDVERLTGKTADEIRAMSVFELRAFYEKGRGGKTIIRQMLELSNKTH